MVSLIQVISDCNCAQILHIKFVRFYNIVEFFYKKGARRLPNQIPITFYLLPIPYYLLAFFLP